MHTTLELLDVAKHQLAIEHGLTLPMSDYRLADLLDLDQRTVSNWRKGRSHIGAKFAPRFAEATGLAVEYVYACIEHERADSEEARSVLKKIAKRFAEHGTAASILLAFLTLLLGATPRADAHPSQGVGALTPFVHNLHYAPYGRALMRLRRLVAEIRVLLNPITVSGSPVAG